MPPLPLLLLTFPSCFCITEPSVSQSQTDTRIIIYTSAGRHGSAGCRARVTVPLMAIERLSFSHSAHLRFAENSLPLPSRPSLLHFLPSVALKSRLPLPLQGLGGRISSPAGPGGTRPPNVFCYIFGMNLHPSNCLLDDKNFVCLLSIKRKYP